MNELNGLDPISLEFEDGSKLIVDESDIILVEAEIEYSGRLQVIKIE